MADKTVTGVRINPDGGYNLVRFDTLHELLRLVGGYVEPVLLRQVGLMLAVDEEAKLKPSPLVNQTATELARRLGARLNPDDMIVGPAVLLGPMTPEGFSDLPAAVIKVIRRVCWTDAPALLADRILAASLPKAG